MDDTGSYVASDVPGGLEKEVERLRGQALLAWEKEARTLQWLGLRDGMAVLEVGGGPGFVTEQLLAMLPSSQITVVERDPVLIERATQYLHERGGERARQVNASVMDTGLPDNSFDFAYARLVFQHLPDPVSAAREVLRVLKPGGRFVVADIDENLHIFDPPAEPEVEAINARFMKEQEARGGSRYRGRRLPRILQQAGFHRLDLEAVMVHSDIIGLDKLDSGLDSERLQAEVEAGLITAEERTLLEASIAHFRASEPLMLITMLMVCGEKP